jgi:uncharacterized membrane protein
MSVGTELRAKAQGGYFGLWTPGFQAVTLWRADGDSSEETPVRNQIIAALAAAVTPLAVAAPASAAPGNGAERYKFSECFTEEPGFEVCVTGRGVFKATKTRSGNFIVVDSSTSTFRLVGDGFTGSGTSRGKFKLLLKDGQEQVVHARFRSSSTFDGVTCSGSFRFMIVRGEVKKEIEDFSCDGDLPEF